MIEKNKKLKVFLATGGSGGHIFPAIAMANKLTDEGNSIYIIADKVYEKYSSCNLNYRIVTTGKTLTSFKDIKNLILGFFQARKIIKENKPDVVVGFGSYATLPILLAAVWTKTPILLHEQNAYIGKINKLFGGYAKKIMITYHELYGAKYKDMSKIIYTGNPVRKEIKNLYNISYKYPKDDEKFIVLITGGSAGARIFSEYLPKIFDNLHLEEQKKLKIYHQVREEYLNKAEEYYKKLDMDVVIQPFFNNMNELLAKAHLIIGRAGSGTLCETSIAGKPSILIPLTNRGRNRQEVNAETFEKNGASILILEKNFNVKDFQKIFFELIKDKNKLEKMSENARKIAVLDAEENVFNIIKTLSN